MSIFWLTTTTQTTAKATAQTTGQTAGGGLLLPCSCSCSCSCPSQFGSLHHHHQHLMEKKMDVRTSGRMDGRKFFPMFNRILSPSDALTAHKCFGTFKGRFPFLLNPLEPKSSLHLVTRSKQGVRSPCRTWFKSASSLLKNLNSSNEWFNMTDPSGET